MKFQIFQHLPLTLLQLKDSTKVGGKTNSLHIYINRANLCFCIHHCSMRKYETVIYCGLQVNNNPLKGSHRCYTARGTRPMNKSFCVRILHTDVLFIGRFYNTNNPKYFKAKLNLRIF